MPLNYPSSGVFIEERVYQEALVSSATTIAAMLIVSARGPVNVNLTTGEEDFITQYGVPNPAIKSHYGALGFFTEGQFLFCRRVVGAGYTYAGVLLQNIDPGSGRELSLTPYGSDNIDGDTFPWDSAEGATSSEDNVLYIHAVGPGGYGDQLAIRMLSDNIAAPSGTSATLNATGGSLGTGTFSYRMTAYNKQGETEATVAFTAVAASGSTNSVTLVWDEVPNAAGYKIYGRAAGTEAFIATVGTGLGTYTDTGAITPNVLLLAPNASSITPSGVFTLQVYDYSVSTTVAQESYDVSLERSSDGFGEQTEIAERINNASRLIRVLTNVPNLVDVPEPVTLTDAGGVPMAFTGGSSGAVVTNSDMILALRDFVDPERYDFNVFIEGGLASTGDISNDAALKQEYINVLKKRGYGVALFDVPPSYQKAQDAIDYRNGLNIDSDRGALFSPDVYVKDVYNNVELYVPQSGFVGGRLAYTDLVSNPGRSPAGLNRGIMPILGLRYLYNQAERDLLAPAGVNYIRKLPGRFALWEQRTMQYDFKATSFLSVRRIIDVIEQTVKKFLLNYVHEPNDDFTIKQIIGLIRAYLSSLTSQRVLNNFEVVSITSNYEKAIGALNIDLFLEPTLPIEKIRLRTNIVQQGADIEAIIEEQRAASGA